MKRAAKDAQSRGPRAESVFPGFRDMAERRRQLVTSLVAHRRQLGLSQTEVAARMGTSQPAVARLESGTADVRLRTLERYAAAVGRQLDWQLSARRAR
jgi:predicted transcriptional regulator